VDDDLYQAFTGFLESKEWDYTTESKEKLNTLIETAKEEKYYEQASEELEELEKKLSYDKQNDLERFKSSIQERLEQEIAGRYYYQKGQIQAGLEEDKQLGKALEVSTDTSLYSGILSGTYQRDNVENVKD